MTNEDIRKRYVHLLNLAADYLIADKDWHKSNSSFDRDKTLRRKDKLKKFVFDEKKVHDAQIDKNELF